MTGIMSYKGYSARIDYDDDDGHLHRPGPLAFVTAWAFMQTRSKVCGKRFHEAVEDYPRDMRQGWQRAAEGFFRAG